MCGRYDLSETGRTLRIGSLEFLLTTPSRYSIAPTDRAPVIRWRQDEWKIDELRWGLVPAWAKDTTSAARNINARSETIAEKPMFRSAFRYRRCVVPADGYLEWEKSLHGRLPWRFIRRDRQPLLFAGLWETWKPPDAPEEILETYTVVTTDANADSAHVHSRMPVILEPEAAARWLDPKADQNVLRDLLVPAREGTLECYRVSTRLNNSRTAVLFDPRIPMDRDGAEP